MTVLRFCFAYAMILGVNAFMIPSCPSPRFSVSNQLPTANFLLRCSAADQTEVIALRPNETLQLLWEEEPFCIAGSVVESVLMADVGSTEGGILDARNKGSLVNVNRTAAESVLRAMESLLQPSHRPITDYSAKGTLRQRSFVSYRMDLAYDGRCFRGWQRQKGPFPSVQQQVEDVLWEIALSQYTVDKDQSPRCSRSTVRVAGRTDAGVHAIGQVTRVRLPRNQKTNSFLAPEDLQSRLDAAAANQASAIVANRSPVYSWRCRRIEVVSDKFHPTFDAKSRSYAYIIDADKLRNWLIRHVYRETSNITNIHAALSDFTALVDSLLRRLEYQTLDYYAMSHGRLASKSSLCTLSTCRATLVASSKDNEENHAAMILTFTGDRFLRRMIRILSSTAIQLALEQLSLAQDCNTTLKEDLFDNAALLKCVLTANRSARARAAPPSGLIFVNAEF